MNVLTSAISSGTAKIFYLSSFCVDLYVTIFGFLPLQAGKFSPIPTIISTVTAMTSVGIVRIIIYSLSLDFELKD